MSKAEVVNEIHKNVRVNFPRRKVIMKDIDDLWQADLIDMQAVSKENNGYKYILVVIDTFSKYAWAYPLKRKTKHDICKAFTDLFGKGRIPNNLQTDLGTEFYNDELKKILTKLNIRHYSTYSVKKASIAERLIRTLKTKMYKLFSLKGNYKWIDGLLKDVVHEYNHSYHRTIGLKPVKVNKNNAKMLHDRYTKLSNRIVKRFKFSVGDFVRISKHKGLFEKGYTPNWSTEIFKIIKVQKTSPPTYKIEDAEKRAILGAFYEQELLKTKHPNIYLIEKVLKTKGNKVYVKWLGLPSNENCWINKSNIVQ